MQGNGFSGDGLDHAFAHHAQRAGDGFVGVVDERARLVARHQAAIGAVAAVGKDLSDSSQPGALGGFQQFAACQAVDGQ